MIGGPGAPDDVLPDLPPAGPSVPNNLPASLTTFVGRRREIAEVRRLLARARLVTLTGPGGCGKTRLALEVAADALGEFRDGVWLVELESVADPTLVAHQVALELGLRDDPGIPIERALSGYLLPRHLLLILDNCEHLAEAAARFSEALLRACPRVGILATSRHLLKVAGEAVYPVPCLTVPDPEALPAAPDQAVALLSWCESVQLFVDRAGLGHPGFALSDQNAATVARICRRLGGLPLALELAAARVRLLPLAQIASQLENHLELRVGGGFLTGPPRHRTLRAAMDWSYDLLSPAEQTLLRRLAVFAGGCSQDAAVAVGTAPGSLRGDLLELLSSLVDKSLLVETERDGSPRYAMLGTLRQYALRLLDASGEAEPTRARHAAYFLRLAEEAEPHLSEGETADWLHLLETEHGNMRAVLRWAVEGGETETALRLAGALWRFWWLHGHLAEGQAWLQGALLASSGVHSATRARALRGAGILAQYRGDFAAARSWLTESLTMYLGLGDRAGTAQILGSLGMVVLDEGDLRLASSLLERSLAFRRDLGNRQGMAQALTGLGRVATEQGRWAEAQSRFRESLLLRREIGHPLGITHSLGLMAYMAVAQGQPARAARLLGAEESLREALGAAVPLNEHPLHDHSVAAARRGLPPEEFATLWAEGRAMDLDRAVAYALSPEAPPTPRPSDPLTRREREVAAMIARGLGNAEIAAALVISERTAETHVSNILGKLGFGSRSQIATWATKREPGGN